MTTILVELATWSRIRHGFTPEERAQFNAQIVGEVICPRAVIIDPERLPAALVESLRRALANAARP